MKRIFFDVEFTGLHQRTTPVSIGLFADTSSFYWEFTDFDSAQVDEWLGENVLPHIGRGDGQTGTREECANALRVWLAEVAGDDKIEIWSDCLAYDWVLFCELFGGARKLPECVYYIPQDICTLFWQAGIDPDINREEFAEVEGGKGYKHSAMWDAKMIFLCFLKLQKMNPRRNDG